MAIKLLIGADGVYTASAWADDLGGSDPPMRIDPDGTVHIHALSAIGAAGSYGLFPSGAGWVLQVNTSATF